MDGGRRRRTRIPTGTGIRTLAVALLVAALAAGCGGSDGEGSAFDRAFIDAMVPHHELAMQMAQDAKGGLASPELIGIADAIIATQREEVEQLLEWREEWFGSRTLGPEEEALEVLGLTAAEAGMSHEGNNLLATDDVDGEFATLMVPHHEGAVRMAELALEHAEHEELRELARRIIDTQSAEIAVLEQHAHDAMPGGHEGDDDRTHE